ncbi:MAG: peptidoglycan DD-metalloendopeptidase family protein [Wigglesworthia glossinidia]|nr:peptidoglycan DD-metalloendopeptidase family protein [Wigglesworthia glossinidia]
MNSQNKNLYILGIYNEPVLAACDGTVVYVGNKIKGYGNLIILKHKNNYLSIYAYNNILLVHNKQQVKSGQKISTMGHSNTNEIKLYFEIRHQGKKVNPLSVLPKKIKKFQ